MRRFKVHYMVLEWFTLHRCFLHATRHAAAAATREAASHINHDSDRGLGSTCIQLQLSWHSGLYIFCKMLQIVTCPAVQVYTMLSWKSGTTNLINSRWICSPR
jgi:hypothetical protein